MVRVWGSDSIELRWACPGCGGETTQETTPLESMNDARVVREDPACYRCRRIDKGVSIFFDR